MSISHSDGEICQQFSGEVEVGDKNEGHQVIRLDATMKRMSTDRIKKGLKTEFWNSPTLMDQREEKESAKNTKNL